MRPIYKSLTVASLALVLLSACGSSGIGDILGGGTDDNRSNYEIRGTVDSVDTSSRSVYLTNVSGYTSMLSSGGSGNRVRVYFDDQTTVDYQGRAYRPQDLERGDQVTVRVDEQGNNTLVAQSMTVTYNSAVGGTTPGSHTSNVRGTVRYVDTSRRTIEIDRGNGSLITVEYAADLPVYYNGQNYRVTDLERGDEIEIRVQDYGNGRYVAQDVSVIRSVSSGSTGSSAALSTIRGTVRSVDTARRTIELESTSWISGFTTGAGGSTMIIQYEQNAGIYVNGRLESIAGLERGDVVEAQVRSLGGSSYMAQSLSLVRDVKLR